LWQACGSIQSAPRYTHADGSAAIVRELAARQRGDSNRLRQVVSSYLGVPYEWGGTTRRGMDCSAFTRATFRETYGVELPRTSKQMYRLGSLVAHQQDLRPGDLVFFKNTYSGSGVSHVGIYIGSGDFAHASSSKGITITPMSNPYFSKRYAGGRRIER
jgi:cell wall-associated NlpC family hydrolase